MSEASTTVRVLPGGPAQERVVVTLFDRFRLQAGGREVDLADGPRRLVALLALRGRVGRARAAATLWPDADPTRAMARLRTQIWRVHQAVPDLIVTDGGQLGLDPAADTDVRRLGKLAGTALAGREGDLAAWTPLAAGGELLPDWDDEWLDDERERLRQLRLHTLEAVALRLAGAGRYGPAVDLALTVLRGDPLRETAHRALIRVHLAEGNLVEARRAHRRCALILQRELGVTPSRATTALLGEPYLTQRHGAPLAGSVTQHQIGARDRQAVAQRRPPATAPGSPGIGSRRPAVGVANAG